MARPLRNQRGGITGLFGLIRDYGPSVEADLVSEGVDLRDIFRRGSGLTLRLLLLRVRGLPADSQTHRALTAEPESQKPTVDRLRERQAHYDQLTKGGE